MFIGCSGSQSMAFRSTYVRQQGLIVGNIMLNEAWSVGHCILMWITGRVLALMSLPLSPCPCPYVGQGPCSAACFPRAATYQASSLQIFSVFFVTLFIKSSRKWRIISFLCSSSPSRCPPPLQIRRCWRSRKV